MRSYESTATVAAAPEEVWRVLVDGRTWPSRDSGVTAVEGAVAPRGKVRIRTEAAPGRAFPVRVTVVELARELPVSRPAVSRHLRLLKEAGLVAEEPRGTRRIHRLQEQGLTAVRDYMERVWGGAAARFRLTAENTEPGA
ncbi:helix-turn-helix domain-containing protein [Geodermatophilus sp. SYSU D00703]